MLALIRCRIFFLPGCYPKIERSRYIQKYNFAYFLYGCETWSLTLREERKLRMFENMVLRRIFGPRREEVTGEWRRLHNKELNDFYYYYYYYFLWRCSPTWAMAFLFLRFRDHTQRRITVGRTSLDVISSSQRTLPDNSQHSRQTSVHVSGGNRTHDRSRRAAVDLRLRPRGHWDRPIYCLCYCLFTSQPGI